MNTNQLVVFNLDTQEYAVDIIYTKEIIRIPTVTKIPNVPAFIEGVFNLRGTVITVIDLKKRFAMEYTERGADSRLLILEFENAKIGIIVDDISEVMRSDQLVIQDVDNELVGISKNSIEGITIVDDRLILLLNAKRLKTDIFKICSEKEIEL